MFIIIVFSPQGEVDGFYSGVFVDTLMHKFHISYSHAEW